MALNAAARKPLLDRYRSGAALLRRAWVEAPAEARSWRPGEGKWSAHEVVVHCADSETYAAIRIRLLLAEPEPLIVGYDETTWAKRFDYQASDPELALHLEIHATQIRRNVAAWCFGNGEAQHDR